mmetsp:Transcript_28009/g.56727  ORF Transcript_28009/g.56727 Transcript_28009/m.56727 type:complete len:454 (-) Transcript_28009:552-1913(-)
MAGTVGCCLIAAQIDALVYCRPVHVGIENKCMMEVKNEGPDHEAKGRRTNNDYDDDDDKIPISPIDMLEEDELVTSLGFLDWKGILKARVNKKLKEASLATPVPGTLTIGTAKLGLDLARIATALPHVQSMELRYDDREGVGVVVDEGEDPFPLGAPRRQIPKTDLRALLNFRNLKELALHLSMRANICLNGSFPVLYDLRGLQKLELFRQSRFRLDLHALSPNLSNLRHLKCVGGREIVGNLGTLRPLRDTLETLLLTSQQTLTGSIMDIADFSRLRVILLRNCIGVEGDIRDIRPQHFPSLKVMDLMNTSVHGVTIESVADATAIMSTWGRLLMTHPCLEFDEPLLVARLSSSSPDLWRRMGARLQLEMVRAPGNRIGWRWSDHWHTECCDMNWLGPEPQPGENDYDEYIQYRRKIEEGQMNSLFRGFTHPPPTEEEYRELRRRISRSHDF